MTDHVLIAQYAEQIERMESERRGTAIYRDSHDPIGLLRRRIHAILALSSGSVIDAMAMHPAQPPSDRTPLWPTEENLNRTEYRMRSDPYFYRLVQMQTIAVVDEAAACFAGLWDQDAVKR